MKKYDHSPIIAKVSGFLYKHIGWVTFILYIGLVRVIFI
jgi:hypothetical protein